MSKLNHYLLFYLINKLEMINVMTACILVIKDASDLNLNEKKLINETFASLRVIQKKLSCS